jgi:hypothetical protein
MASQQIGALLVLAEGREVDSAVFHANDLPAKGNWNTTARLEKR